MKYTAQYQISWHDTDANRRLRPSQLLVYMQETANLQLKDSGVSLDELRDARGLAFLLSRITVRMYEPLYAYDRIDVQTWVCEGHGLRFDRCFCVLRDGKVVAEAYSAWALMNLNEKRLMRANEFSYNFPPDEAMSGELTARVRYPALAQMELAGERRIVYSDIDYNGHMNNTHYPDMLCDFTDGILQKKVVGMSLSFLHEGTFGHTLKVYRQVSEDGCYFRTVDEDGTSCLEAVLLTEEDASLKSEQDEENT